MISAYSRRLLPLFTGQVQIVENPHARALSLDGRRWEIQIKSRGRVMYRVIYHRGETRLAADSNRRIRELAASLEALELPLPAADIYEYWLLDSANDSPLALLDASDRLKDMDLRPGDPEWKALPASMMPIDATAPEQQGALPPVNYRFQQAVNQRAGKTPRAAWFKRRAGDSTDFPVCLVSETWQNDHDNELCQRYITRQAPRLLMLHALAADDRQRLEIHAQGQPLEVERFFPLYPAVTDDRLMSTIRVKARLQRAAGNVHNTEPTRWYRDF